MGAKKSGLDSWGSLGEAIKSVMGPSNVAKYYAAKNDDDKKAKPSSYKKGGKVEKTGMAKVHKGERVLTKKQATKPVIKKAIKKVVKKK